MRATRGLYLEWCWNLVLDLNFVSLSDSEIQHLLIQSNIIGTMMKKQKSRI